MDISIVSSLERPLLNQSGWQFFRKHPERLSLASCLNPLLTCPMGTAGVILRQQTDRTQVNLLQPVWRWPFKTKGPGRVKYRTALHSGLNFGVKRISQADRCTEGVLRHLLVTLVSSYYHYNIVSIVVFTHTPSWVLFLGRFKMAPGGSPNKKL